MNPDGWADRERDYRSVTPAGVLRELARGAALDAIATGQQLRGQTRTARTTPRVQFIYLHHVFDDERETFRAHIGRLKQEYTFITYSEGVRRCLQGDIDRPYATLSFDDGVESQLTGARILHEMGLSACFFVCPGIVGETSRERLEWWCRERLHRPATKVLGWPELEAMLAMGHEIGSHTNTHVDLGALSAEQAREELSLAHDALRARLGADSARHFAWPYGLFHNMTAANAASVFEVGYQTCASAVRGAHGPEMRGKHRPCFRRDLLIPLWSKRQMNALLVRNVQRMGPENATWPAGWSTTIGSAA